jgi:single-strand DNA-binding protein
MKERAEGHNVSVHVDKMGRRIAEACVKGDILLIEGPIETRRYTAAGGDTKYITEIAVRPFQGTVRRMPTPARKAVEPGYADAQSTDAAIASLSADEASANENPTVDELADVFDNWGADDGVSFGDGDGDDGFPF